MIVKSSRGQEYNIAEDLSSDFRFIMAFKAVRSGDGQKAADAAVELVELVLGDDMQRFLKEIAEDSGRVPVDRVFGELRVLLDQAVENRDAKNS